MLRQGVLVAALLLATGAPAKADYVFDPADLPKCFVCEPELDAAACVDEQRIRAWDSVYGGRSDYWFDSLLWDVNLYFAQDAPALPDPAQIDLSLPHTDRLGYQTPNLVDAVYSIARRPYGGWAFAIDRDAQMRMVRPRLKREIDPAAEQRFASWLPTSLAEAAEPLSAFYIFEEADLTQCKGAIAQLRAFPMQRGAPLWSERELGWEPGKKRPDSDVIIVTADGDSVFVRARGVPDQGGAGRSVGAASVVIDQSNGGKGYDWAKAMAEAARPCLKPSAAPPPWDKLLRAGIERMGK